MLVAFTSWPYEAISPMSGLPSADNWGEGLEDKTLERHDKKK